MKETKEEEDLIGIGVTLFFFLFFNGDLTGREISFVVAVE